MTTLRQAAQQALEALSDLIDCGAEAWGNHRFCVRCGIEALHDLRQALKAEQHDEPVAYAVPGAVEWKRRQSEVTIKLTRKPHPEYGFTEPLYTRPQPAQQPLTDDQLFDVFEGKDSEIWWQFDFGRFQMVARAIERAHGIGGEA